MTEELEEDIYCRECQGCGEVGCDGIRSFLEAHVRGKTNCLHEDSFIDDILWAYRHLETEEDYPT